MSPILVRPVREQLEHDRLIRYLQAKYKRKFEVAANLGEEQLNPVKLGQHTFFPDLILTVGGKKLAGLIEVETGESVNNLEAMAQWVHFGKARVPFHLYVPVQGVDAARRLCEANHVRVSEVWTYRPLLEGFDLVKVTSDAAAPHARPTARPVSKPTAQRPIPAKGAGSGAPSARATVKGGASKTAKSAAPAKRAAKAAAKPKPALKHQPNKNHRKNHKKR